MGHNMSTPVSAPLVGHRRVKKRIFIPAIVLALALLVLIGAYVRGTWADTVARDPQTSAEGTVSQLYQTPNGNVQVRCAILVDAPAAKVWDVVRDYGSHPRFLPYVRETQVQPREGGRVYLTGVARSQMWGDWPFAMEITHKSVADKEYTASWDEPTSTLLVNRGSWTLTAKGANLTLVVYALQWEVAQYPNFFVRNVLLDRLYQVLYALRDEVYRRQDGK
jgi:ribosome-associated toxin RatA of RatAB toxin-antitoxin module